MYVTKSDIIMLDNELLKNEIQIQQSGNLTIFIPSIKTSFKQNC